MNRTKVLIVDDDRNILFAFREVLKKEGLALTEAVDGEEAISKFLSEKPDIVFMDITMPKSDGLEALKKIKAMNDSTPVIMITGQGTMQTAVQAMKLGAFEYLTKPLSVSKIRDILQKALLSVDKKIEIEKPALEANITDQHELIGQSVQMHEIYKLIGSISLTPNSTSVLITGETGTGKELVARAIHSNSAFSSEPFVAINCTALPATLLESELFGHEKGTFTGAENKKLGKFEIAKNGTIFLDEIGDLSSDLQIKLLRVLQEREFERLGGNDNIKVEARFIAATHQNMANKVKDGTFREDLYYRLNGVVTQIPPLREHLEDVPLLCEYFLQRYSIKLKKNIKGFSKKALDYLSSYLFPGNIRELENMVERAIMLTQGDILFIEIFNEMKEVNTSFQEGIPILNEDFTESRNHILTLFEKQFLKTQLNKNKNNISAAAKASNMSRQNFHRLVIKHNLQTNGEKD